MAQPPLIWREPEQFAAGDSLIFQRNLPSYLPSDGWGIQLTVSLVGPNGATIQQQVNSAPDSTNTFHTFNVANFLAAANAGTYIFSEEAINSGTGQKNQIYYNDNFQVGPDLSAGTSTQTLTIAQQMITQIQSTLLELYARTSKETDIQRSRFVLMEIDKVRGEENYWQERRKIEVQNERAANGNAPGNITRPLFNIGC